MIFVIIQYKDRYKYRFGDKYTDNNYNCYIGTQLRRHNMSIIGKQLPEFTLDAFKKPELVKVSTADVLGKWSVFVFYPADFTFVCPTELEDVQNSYAELKELGCEV